MEIKEIRKIREQTAIAFLNIAISKFENIIDYIGDDIEYTKILEILEETAEIFKYYD